MNDAQNENGEGLKKAMLIQILTIWVLLTTALPAFQYITNTHTHTHTHPFYYILLPSCAMAELTKSRKTWKISLLVSEMGVACPASIAKEVVGP